LSQATERTSVWKGGRPDKLNVGLEEPAKYLCVVVGHTPALDRLKDAEYDLHVVLLIVHLHHLRKSSSIATSTVL
jgi:hypothetical protein